MNDNLAPLDDLDRAIIEATAQGLPLTARPYHIIGELVGTEEKEVIRRLKHLLANGVVRRIGVVPNHYKLGITANGMTVWDVDDDAAQELGRWVGALDFVSHCYLRPRRLPGWPYNLFAMVHGSSRQEVLLKAQQIADGLKPSLHASDILFSTRILKKTGLRLAKRGPECSA